MCVTARSWLAREPHVVKLADGSPRLIGAHGIARHTVHARLGVELAREREIHTNVWPDISRNQVDDFLRVSRIPYVNVDKPQRML